MKAPASPPADAARQASDVILVYAAQDGAIAAMLQEQLVAASRSTHAIRTDHEPSAEDRAALREGRALVLLLSNSSLADARFCELREEALRRRSQVVPVHVEETMADSSGSGGIRLVPDEALESFQDVTKGLARVVGKVAEILNEMSTNQDRKKLKVLVLAPAPRREHALRQKQEKEKVLAALAEAGATKELEILWVFAATFEEIAPTILRERPDIVHISGHGGVFKGDNVLAFVDDLGEIDRVQMQDIVDLFAAPPIVRQVRCLILSTCKGAPIASRVAQSLGLAIASGTEIGDEAALAFSKAFYGALVYTYVGDVATAIDEALSIARPNFRNKSEKNEKHEAPRLFRKGDAIVDLPPVLKASADVDRHLELRTEGHKINVTVDDLRRNDKIWDDRINSQKFPDQVLVLHTLADAALAEELFTVLRARNVAARLVYWDRTQMPGGALVKAEWTRQVESARAAVLLLSAKALAEPLWDEQARRILARADAGKVELFPVQLRPVALDLTDFAERSLFPESLDGQALSTLPSEERAEIWQELVRAILTRLAPKPQS